MHILRVSLVRSLAYFKEKFSRSYLGQIWNTLAAAVTMFVISLVWSNIWGVDLKSYLPYFSLAYFVHSFTSSCISESTLSIQSDLPFYRQYKFPIYLSTVTVLFRQSIIFLFHMPVYLSCILIFDSSNFFSSIFVFLGIILINVYVFPLCVIVSLICYKYRDLTGLINIVTSISVVVTPVLWRLDQVPADYQLYVMFSPYAVAVLWMDAVSSGSIPSVNLLIVSGLQFTITSIMAVLTMRSVGKYVRAAL